MNELIERIGNLGRDLVCEQGFAPLERVLPMSGLAGAQFHACVAKQERKRLDVHALLAWQGQDPLDLKARAAALRRALEAAAAFFSGQVIVTFFLVAKTPSEAE